MVMLFGQPLLWYHPDKNDKDNLPDVYYELDLATSPYSQLPTHFREFVRKFVMSDVQLRPTLGLLLQDPAVAEFLGWLGEEDPVS